MGKKFAYTPVRDSEAGSFLTKGEKALLVEEKVVFPITAVEGPVTEETEDYGTQTRYIVTIELDGADGETEERLLGFDAVGKVKSRNALLKEYQAHLEDEDAEVSLFRMRKVKRSFVLDRLDDDGNVVEAE